MDNEEGEIRNLWTRASKNICNGDWLSYAECWSHSSNPDQGEWLEGWEEIGVKYEEMLNSGISCNIIRNDFKLSISASADMAYGTVDIHIHFKDTAKTKLHLWETII